MAAAVAVAGKTLRLQLAAGVGAVGIRQANRQVLRLGVTADSQTWLAPASTFKALTGRLALGTRITAIWEAVAVAALPMLLLRTLAAGRCLAAVGADRVPEQLPSLL